VSSSDVGVDVVDGKIYLAEGRVADLVDNPPEA
jgi:hypothetical protein